MASTHKHIRSSTASKRPTTAIADGQIALNTNSATPGLFFKDSTGATIIKVGPVHVGTTAPNATPAAGGSSGNSTGEVWLDTSLTPPGVKIWNGSAWVNGTPAGSTTVQGLLELATNAETQTGSDTARAVTPAGLQSKVSDSVSTTSSTTIASSTAVKTAYDLANAALPKAGGTVTGNLEIGTTGSLTFEGATADAFETTLAVTDPTADRTITLPDVSGNVVTTGDTGTVTSTMIADGTIVNDDVNASAAIAYSKLALTGSIVDADVSASAEIAVSKLADGAARQLLQTDAAGTGVEWTDNVDIPGTLDVTGAAVFDSTANIAGNLTVDTNTLYVDATNNRVGIGTTPDAPLHIKATGGSTNSINTALIVNYESTGPQALGAGTAIVLRGSSGGGGTANYDQAQIVTSTTGSNNDHGLDFYTRRNFASGLIKRFSIDEYGCLRNYAVATTPAAIFGFEGGEAARIDGSGRLLVGTSSAPANGSWAPNSRLVSIGNTDGTNSAAVLTLGIARAASTVPTNNDVGVITFTGNDGYEFGRIQCQADAAAGSGDYPGRLVFSTTADGASTPTERMKITKEGTIRSYNVGTTEANIICVNDGSSPNSIIYFQTSTAELGKIYRGAGNSVVYSTSSDYRLKENVTLIADGIERVKQLKPSRFNWVSEPNKTVDGFIAHEVEPVVPDAVSGEKNAVDDEGNIKPQSLSMPCLIPLLTAALQEAIAKIETLEAKVAALEGA